MTVGVPGSIAEVDAAWLSRALQEGGALHGAEVTAVDVEPIGIGVGLLGELARVRPLYAGDDPAAPPSVVVKLPSPHPANRARGLAFAFYEREIRFYREIAPSAAIRVPRCYWSGMEPAGERFGLVLEDLSELQMADQVAGVSPERATVAVQHLARFHAQWWQSTALAGLDWMPLSNGAVTMQAVGVYEHGWPLFLENVGHRLSAEARVVGERTRDVFAWLLDRMGEPPRTIVHTDFRLDNLFFGPPGTADAVAVIDWQLATRGRAAYDVAYLLCQSMDVDERRAHEMEILRRWHEALAAGGVEGYSWTDAVRDYRTGAAICLVIPVAAGADMELDNERGRALLQAFTDRAFAAAVELDVTELYPH